MARRSGASDPSNLMGSSARAIVHLRAQRRRKRLGLIFGAGASKALGFPGWEELVDRIATHEAVKAEDILSGAKTIKPPRSLAALTHMMFDHYRARKLGGAGIDKSVPLLQEQRIKSDWLRIIHGELYRDVPKSAVDRKKSINDHPYLRSFLDVIKASALTVNYNFDDTIEKLLMFSRDEEEESTTRGYETIDKPNAQFQKPAGVIYHPNGFLPSRFDDGASVDLVFDSDGFQDQLISAANGRYVHLSNYLSRNTCLLIGLSLDDATLQSMLRQNAVASPGNIHYFVHYVGSEDLSAEARKMVFDSNFTSYNLYTLFLSADGIRNMADLIRMPDSQFARFHPNSRKLVYYIVGSIGSGKSTAASNFRSLITYDEWIDERLPELARPQSDEDDASSIDNWIAEQFRKKNYALNDCKEGIHLVDRCPLDPLTFPGDKRAKAANLLGTMTHDNAMTIAQGHVIMLDCDLDELKHRNSLKHKYWDDEELENLMSEIALVYENVTKTVLCTRGRSIDEVAREIARVIFLADYCPVDIGVELQKYCESVDA